MRILDKANDRALNNIMILLTLEELHELKGYIEDMLECDDFTHFHLDDKDYSHEITFAKYGDGAERLYSRRTIELIEHDE